MSHLIYLTGITSTGKTTTGKWLSKYLGCPLISADHIYNIVGRKIGERHPEQLVFPERWRQIENHKQLKYQAFKHLIEVEKAEKSNVVIIEGFTLFFAEEREMIEDILNPNWITTFLLKPDFETWVQFRLSKYGTMPTYQSFLSLYDKFEPPKHFYTIHDTTILRSHYLRYQKKGFTDKKWNAIDIQTTGKTILDIGCNEGQIGKYCLEQGAKKVTGVDKNWRYLEIARQNGLQVCLAQIENYNADFWKQKFDIVLCLATLHYIWNKEKFIQKISKITKEQCVVEVPILQEDGLKCGKKHEVLIPTKDMMMFWLKRYFKTVVVGNESPAPDDSYRLVFKAYK